jgi:PAS domain S-box-containing protein
MKLFFQANLDYIFFLYGLSFVLLAFVCREMRNEKESGVAWVPLALFGLIHGINEWLDMVALSLRDTPAFTAIRLGFMIVSFIFLFETGRAGTGTLRGRTPGRWILLPFILIPLLCCPELGLTGMNALARYALGLTGGLWAALTLFWAGQKTRSRPLIAASAALAFYAFATGAVVPTMGFFPASLLNHASFFQITSMPIQLVRGILAILVTLAVWKYYESLTSREFEFSIRRAELLHRKSMLTVTLVLVLGGWGLTYFFGQHAHNELVQGISEQARLSAAGVSAEEWARAVNFHRFFAIFITCLLVTIVIGLYIYIASRSHIEKALRKSEQHFRTILEDIQLATMILDPEGKILFCNEYLLNLTGWSAGEVNGADWFEIFIPLENREKIKNLYFEKIRTDSFPPQHANEILTKDGERRLIFWNNIFFRDARGNIQESVSIGEDITEKKQMERQLLQAEKLSAVGRLAAGVAHELNNPLAVILMSAQSGIKRLSTEDSMFPLLNSIEQHAHRCKALIKQLLLFSNTKQVDSIEVSVLTEIETALDLIRKQNRNNAVLIDSLLDKETPQVLSSPGQIQQILLHLCHNALDAMPGSGTLTVSARPILKEKASLVQIQVEDTGRGISKEWMEKIFEPFFTTKEVGQSTGLNLSLCHELVKRNGGTIAVQSKVGKGTIFTITFPAAPPYPD